MLLRLVLGLTLGKGLRSGEKQDAADGADGDRCAAEGEGDAPARNEEDIAALELAQQILQENGYVVGMEDLEPHHRASIRRGSHGDGSVTGGEGDGVPEEEDDEDEEDRELCAFC